jgi:hypothetical protein
MPDRVHHSEPVIWFGYVNKTLKRAFRFPWCEFRRAAGPLLSQNIEAHCQIDSDAAGAQAPVAGWLAGRIRLPLAERQYRFVAMPDSGSSLEPRRPSR